MRRMTKGARLTDGLKRGVLLAVGYGLARSITANAYNTAFGAELAEKLGFVAQPSFTLVTNLVSVAVAVALVALVLRGYARPGQPAVADASGSAHASQSESASRSWTGRLLSFAGGRIPFAALLLSAVVLLLGYGLSAAGVFSLLGVGVGAVVCALVYAVGSVVLTLAWFAPFAREPQTGVAVRGLVCGYLVQAGGFLVLAQLCGWALFAAAALALVLCIAAYAGFSTCVPAEKSPASPVGDSHSDAARVSHGDAAASQAELPSVVASFKGDLASLFPSFLCVFVLTAVVALLHSSVIGGVFEPVVGAVPMAESLLIAAALLAAVVFISRRVPSTASVYRVLFPVMLVALSLLPFIPGVFGHYAGMVMVVCYNLVGMAFVLFLVETAHDAHVPPVALMGVYQAGTQLSTVIGLELGSLLNGLEARAEASYATILILVCIYLLAMVLVALSRRSERAAQPSSRGHAVQGGVSQPADAAGEAGNPTPATSSSPSSAADASEQAFEQQQEVRGRVGARVEEFALSRGLTAREAQVLVQLARGWSANAIAAELGITQNTAWAHIKRIYVKLGVHSKQELIEYVEREVIARQG